MKIRMLTITAVWALSAVLAACGDDAGEQGGPDASPEVTLDADTVVDADVPVADADVEADAGDEVAEAPADNDSLQNPAESYFLSNTGTRDFTYADEISSPTGDAEDFVEFEFPNNSNPDQTVRITLDCTITGQADAQGAAVIFEDGVQDNSLRAPCNDGEQVLTVDNTKVQTVRIGFSSVADPTHIDYTLTVIGFE
jgi:hypothetical protein